MSGATDEAVPNIHPHLYVPEIKSPSPKVVYATALRPFIATDDKSRREASALTRALDENYRAFTSACESTAISADGMSAALRDYVAVLQALINAGSGSAAAPGIDAALDAATKLSGDNSDAAPAPAHAGLSGDSPLRYAVPFGWTQTLLGGKHPSSDKNGDVPAVADAAYELMSVVTAAGVWALRRAGNLCESTPTGVASGPSGDAYKLLRMAAGWFDYAASAVLPLAGGSFGADAAPPDATPDVLRAAAAAAVADAQAITVLRAIQKGNAPSLIASLAVDTRDQYRAAAAALAAFSPAAGSKLATYLQYKALSFESYAQLFSGIALWKGQKDPAVGAALRALKEAETAFLSAKKAAAAYDKAAPSSLGKVHGRFDDDLDRRLYDALRRAEKENESVYYQKIPAEAPPLPEGKRLAGAMPFELPEMAKEARGVDMAVFKGLPTSAAEQQQKAGAAKAKKGCCGCLRCLFCCCGTAAAVDATAEAVKKNEDEKKKKNEEGEKKEEGKKTEESKTDEKK